MSAGVVSVRWDPTMSVALDSRLSDIIAAVGFASKDPVGFKAIEEKLRARSCETPAALQSWTRSELLALVGGCETKEKARYYVRLLTTVTGIQLKEGDVDVKAEMGGDKSGACSKQVDVSVNFDIDNPIDLRPLLNVDIDVDISDN